MYRILGIDFKRVGKLILILDDFADKPGIRICAVTGFPNREEHRSRAFNTKHPT